MNERIQKIIKHPLSIPVAVGVISFGVGAGFGYILGKRTKPEVHEIPHPVDFESVLKDRQDKPKIPWAEKEKEIVKYIEEHSEPDAPTDTVEEEILVDEEVVTEEVFANNGDDGWSYEAELKHRSPERPYVLHKDEFYADERDYSQITLTYYAGDDILTDEDDTPIYNHHDVVGDMLFGHGSTDPNVFYVRNDKLHAEYEILYQPGLYSEEVLGLEIENNERAKDLKHTSNKFRMD